MKKTTFDNKSILNEGGNYIEQWKQSQKLRKRHFAMMTSLKMMKTTFKDVENPLNGIKKYQRWRGKNKKNLNSFRVQ